MYDKYTAANSFSIGPTLPKHKAVLFSGSTGNNKSSFIVHLRQGGACSGYTFAASLTVDNSPYIFPMEISEIPNTLPSGMTAYYLN